MHMIRGYRKDKALKLWIINLKALSFLKVIRIGNSMNFGMLPSHCPLYEEYSLLQKANTPVIIIISLHNEYPLTVLFPKFDWQFDISNIHTPFPAYS